MKTFGPAATTRAVDQLGALRAEIADLQAEAKRIETVLKESGAGTYEGADYRATVSIATRATVAWKAIAEKLGASAQMIRGNTKHAEVTTLKVTARLKDAA